jgi:hypothetical protein
LEQPTRGRHIKLVFGAVALGSIISTSAFAQSQAQQDRIDRVAQLVVTAPMCQRLGMTVDPEIGTNVNGGVKVVHWAAQNQAS